MEIIVRQCRIEEIEQSPEIDALLFDYDEECRISGLPDPDPQFPAYKAMEATGSLVAFGAWLGGELVGFLNIIVANIPHYGKAMATTESYFVTPSARDTGAGMKLLRSAERHCKSNHVICLFVSAPVDSKLDAVMSRHPEYMHTNRVYMRGFA